MQVNDRDMQVVEKIVKYCEEIEHAHNEYHCDYAVFSDDFKDAYRQIPWRAIRGMRNVVAHEYGKIDVETVWETAEDGTRELKEFCQQRLLNGKC